MKRILCFSLALLLFSSMLPFASAAEIVTEEQIIYYDDGSYLTITTVQSAARTADSTSGFKRIVYVDTEGNSCWRAILTGTFTYDGTSATCAEANCEIYIYDTAYYVVSKTAAKSGSTATASITIGRTVLGITVAKDSYSMTLTCDKNGTLS